MTVETGLAQSALVIVVGEAEPVVGRYRLLHDPVAEQGVPAHITILFPFPIDIDEATAGRIERLAASIEPFDITFAATARFPGGVLYLVPEPDGPIRAMILRAVEAFPDHPPYGGEIADPTPHLTIGMDLDEETADAVDAKVAPHLPIRSRVDRLALLATNDDGGWSSTRDWPLGSDSHDDVRKPSDRR